MFLVNCQLAVQKLQSIGFNFNFSAFVIRIVLYSAENSRIWVLVECCCKANCIPSPIYSASWCFFVPPQLKCSEMKLKLPKYVKEEDTVTSDDDQAENSVEEAEAAPVPAVVRPATRSLRSSVVVCNLFCILGATWPHFYELWSIKL